MVCRFCSARWMVPMETADDKRALNNKIVNSSAWSVGTQLTLQLIGLISTVILARLLVPADFGLVALASLIIAAIEIFSNFGFEIWIIRHQSVDTAHYNTVWTLRVLRGCINATILVLIAQLASDFFNEPRLFSVLIVLAAAVLVESLHNVGVVDFRKHLQFDKEFLLLAGCKVSGFMVTIPIALLTRSYWALVAGVVASNVARLVLSFVMHDFRPRFSLAHWREIFDFVKWLLAGGLMAFIYRHSPTFILGKMSGSQTLGIYSVAFEIIDMISTVILMPVRKVLMPAYAKLNQDMARLRVSFLDGLGIIFMLGVPAAAGIGLVADPLVRVVLGEQWLEAIPVIQALTLYSIAAIGFANQGPCLTALGRVKLFSYLLGMGAILLIPSFIWATANYGLLGGALAVGATNIVLFVVSLLVTLRILGVSIGAVWQRTWRSALATLMMAMVLVTLRYNAALSEWASFMELMALVVAGVLVYVTTTLLLWYLSGLPNGPERQAFAYIVSREWYRRADRVERDVGRRGGPH